MKKILVLLIALLMVGCEAKDPEKPKQIIEKAVKQEQQVEQPKEEVKEEPKEEVKEEPKEEARQASNKAGYSAIEAEANREARIAELEAELARLKNEK